MLRRRWSVSPLRAEVGALEAENASMKARLSRLEEAVAALPAHGSESR